MWFLPDGSEIAAQRSSDAMVQVGRATEMLLTV
jgi:hypothetical protein